MKRFLITVTKRAVFGSAVYFPICLTLGIVEQLSSGQFGDFRGFFASIIVPRVFQAIFVGLLVALIITGLEFVTGLRWK
jgi:hypothetical protein